MPTLFHSSQSRLHSRNIWRTLKKKNTDAPGQPLKILIQLIWVRLWHPHLFKYQSDQHWRYTSEQADNKSYTPFTSCLYSNDALGVCVLRHTCMRTHLTTFPNVIYPFFEFEIKSHYFFESFIDVNYQHQSTFPLIPCDIPIHPRSLQASLVVIFSVTHN